MVNARILYVDVPNVNYGLIDLISMNNWEEVKVRYSINQSSTIFKF